DAPRALEHVLVRVVQVGIRNAAGGDREQRVGGEPVARFDEPEKLAAPLADGGTLQHVEARIRLRAQRGGGGGQRVLVLWMPEEDKVDRRLPGERMAGGGLALQLHRAWGVLRQPRAIGRGLGVGRWA